MELTINENSIEQLVNELVDTTTSEAFLNEIYKISNAGAQEKYSVASEIATLDNLKNKGIKVPDTMRIALRNFEIPIDTKLLNKKVNDPMVCYETGCASVFYNNKLVTISLNNRNPSTKLNTPKEIKEALLKEFIPIKDLVLSPNFQGLLSELYNLPKDDRKQFVFDVILNSDELKKRDIKVPNGVFIRRSYFTDNRPTLFCVTRQTAMASPWDKATITFDNYL